MRAALLCCGLVVSVFVAGCGSSCPDKTKLCSGVCSDLSSDALNCGACGTACASGQACTNGTCVVTCPTGSTACGDLCVNASTDQDNCGTCGTKCAAGQACTAGVCGAACLVGYSACGLDGGVGDGGGGVACANLSVDSINCGSCGFLCPAGTVCNGNGTCAADCATGFNGCTGTSGHLYCANFQDDNANCGSCGSPCAAGQACSAAKCAASCAEGYNACGSDGGVGICADFQTDPLNCGSCGHPCAGGTACSGGQCVETCASGYSACTDGGGYCANFLTDSLNCGVCGKACPAGQSCQGSVCAADCAAGFSACDLGGAGGGYCANLSVDGDNCGTCGKACPAGQVCNGSGTCTETCASGYSACGGIADGGPAGLFDAGPPSCASLTTDRGNCGFCGNVCGAGKSCTSGICVENCAAGYSACGTTTKFCANTKTDVANCGSCGNNCSASYEAAGCCNGTCTSLATGDLNNCGTCGTVCGGSEPACCEGTCADQAKDLNNCGGCGNKCVSGTTPACCASGKSSTCTDSWNDPANCGGCGTTCSSGFCAGACCNAACGEDLTTACAGSCDGTGACTHPTCGTGFGCNQGNTCQTSCASDADCASGGYACRGAPGGLCCMPFTSGGTIYVDGMLGSDTGNCCDDPSTPCQTIGAALTLMNNAKVTGMTIAVSWNATPKTRADWNPANGETYPIQLGSGVTIYAPGIFFSPTGAASDVFDVYASSATDTGTVTIEGDPAIDFVFIGIDSQQASLTSTTIAVNTGVASQTAVPVVLNNVWMNGQTEALNLGAGSNVSLGPSPVIIGSGASTANPLAVTSPGAGIYCQGTAASPATLSDVDAGGASVLQVDSQDTSHATKGQMYAYDSCNVTLSQKPIFGLPPPCPNPKVDGEGLLLGGASTVSLTGATIQCTYNHGMDIGEVTTLGATPTVSLDNTLIQYTGQTGVKVNTGSLGPVTNSSLYHCRFGAVLDGPGSMDLSGGGNIVACNTNAEPGLFNTTNATFPGIGVWNDSTVNASLDASNILWDVNPPSYWSCTDAAGTVSASTCSCSSGTCAGNNIAAPDGSDALTNANTNASPVVLNNPKLQTKFTCN